MVASWVAVQSTWLEIELDGIFKRVHFSRERERDPRRERNSRGIQEDGAFKRVQEGEEKCVLGIYPLLLDTPQWLS